MSETVPALRERWRARLAAFERQVVHRPDLRHAAVAVSLCVTAEVPSFLITRRSPRLRAHAGQWALPGGRLDEGETPSVAARRELHEELGVAVDEADVLGLLDDYVTRSGYVMTPVVVWAGEDPELVPAAHEVAAAYRVPLAELDRPDSPRYISIPESDRPVVQIPLLGDLIHAPTAAILFQTREVLLHGRATRVDHLEQPVWAWR